MTRRVPRRSGPPAAAAALAVLLSAGAHAQGLEDHLAYTLSDRLRFEKVSWFRPPAEAAATDAHDYGFFGNQLRAGFRLTYSRLQLVVEAQQTRLLDLPTEAALRPPLGALGPGGTYSAHHPGETDPGETFLKQAYLLVRGSGVAATLGRFELADGLETLPGDAALGWLKRARIAERLVGPFGWTHVTRSLDGARLTVDRPAWNLTAFGARPSFGGFDVAAHRRIDDVGLGGVALTRKQRAGATPLDARLFLLGYEDHRQRPLKVDNRSPPLRAADRDPIRVRTVGGHAISVLDAGRGAFDLLVWSAAQRGSWGRLEHRAWAAALEGGYRWRQAPWAPWLRAGCNRSSGDTDPVDDEHGTFFQMLPTARIYAQFPFYNLMNNEDLFLQAVLEPTPRISVRADVHHLRLAEGRDLWYSGGGATNDRFFGFSGLASGGARDLALLMDLGVSARLHDRVTAYAYVGHAQGDDVVARTFAGRDATYAYLELTFRY